MATLGTTLIQTKQGTPSATSSFGLTLDATTKQGNAIIAYAYTGDRTAEARSGGMTDDGGNTYVLRATWNGNNNATIYHYYAVNTSPATTITQAYAGGTKNKVIVAREYTDLVSNVTSAENNVGTSGVGTHTLDSLAFTQSDAVVIGFCAVQASSPTLALTAGSPFGNFLSTTVTDTNTAIFGICDLPVYNATGSTQTLSMDFGGTGVSGSLFLGELWLEGGVKAIGGGQFGMGDGGGGSGIYG